MSRRNVRELSDDLLIAACRPNRFEAAVLRVVFTTPGLIVWAMLLVGSLAWGIVWASTRMEAFIDALNERVGHLLGGVAGVVGLCVGLWLVVVFWIGLPLWLFGLRPRPYRDELRRRFAGAPIKVHVADLDAAHRAEPGSSPEVVVLMTGSDGMSGCAYDRRVTIWPDGRGRAESRWITFSVPAQENGQGWFGRAGRALSSDEIIDVRHLLACLPGDFVRLPGQWTDSMTGSMVVWTPERGAWQRCEGEFVYDLTEVDPSVAAKPAVRLMAKALELAHTPRHLPE